MEPSRSGNVVILNVLIKSENVVTPSTAGFVGWESLYEPLQHT